ncbi:MAG: FKBP-type peptidyl-prolyl cis-trans isomerase [Treponema sp.]|jgi:FKBP-type peptidyl-prolyl cis-trans isomerase FkpA|nr:FKBP-type peptidyl-prolyl cis-trans isomerase [Treponema sp.]
MKRILIFFAVFSVFMLASACKNKEKTPQDSASAGKAAESAQAGSLDGDVSYAFGMAFASELKDLDLTFNYDEFAKGFKDSLVESGKTRLSEEDAMQKVGTAYSEALQARTENLKKKEAEFLERNGKKAEVATTPSGLQYEVVKEGDGAKPFANSTVKVNYEGKLMDGTVFDSSYERGEPIEFPLNGVIKGWTEGLQLMSIGSTYIFYIPSNLAYGENGSGRAIPPYSPLTFKVELLEIK